MPATAYFSPNCIIPRSALASTGHSVGPTPPQPTLSLDLDNVIRDQIGSIIAAVKRRHGLTLEREMFSCWDPPLGDLLRITNAEFTNWAWTDPMIFAEARPLPGVIPALRHLSRDYRLVITTSTAWPQLTEPWLRRWNIPYSAIVHTTDKSSVAFDRHIDDAPTTLLKLSEAGRQVICFRLPWNAHLADLPSFSHWNKIGELL